MAGYVDVELDMICGGLFDNIDDFLDFNTDDEALGAADSAAAAAGDGRQPIAPPPAAAAPDPLSGASDANRICDDLNIGEDWIADLLDDSSFDLALNAATAIVAAGDPKEEEDSLFQSFSPVSVLSSSSISDEKSGGGGGAGSSSSSSSDSTNTSIETAGLAPAGSAAMPVPGRARSKRPRRAAPAPAPIVPPAILHHCEVPTMRKKKKSDVGDEEGVVGARKCRHCGIQKTPQWRAGPTGPKTLCNACGVRYKSGRLFPEYRPAASPTYVPSVHSNSHKRVVEMRNKSCRWRAATPSPDCPAAKNCDLLAYIKWRRE